VTAWFLQASYDSREGVGQEHVTEASWLAIFITRGSVHPQARMESSRRLRLKVGDVLHERHD